ncbi:MAG TPA: methyl-accepting chemotaxis protein [Treponemataceae bacterium]|nr:methyl-accepting chemotaxis protein [Treponemataceae bacterium]
MFNNLKLAIKIGGGFTLVLLLTVIISVISVFSLRSLQVTSHKNDTTGVIVQTMQNGTIAGKNFVITKQDGYAAEVEKAMTDIDVLAKGLLDIEKNTAHQELFRSIIGGALTYKVNLSDYVRFEREQSGIDKDMSENAQRLEGLIRKYRDSQMANSMLASLYAAQYEMEGYLLTSDAARLVSLKAAIAKISAYANALRAQGDASTRALSDDVISAAENYSSLIENYVKLAAAQEVSRLKAADGGAATIKNATKVSDEAAAEMTALMLTTIVTVLASALVAVLIGIIMTVIITRLITGAMRKGVDFATLIAQGDLSAQLDIHQNDEIGMLAKALQDMLERLTQIVEEVNSAARQVAAGSQQLSSTSQEMSQGATEQAASVEEISSSMEEMTSNIKQNADNAMQTEKIAQKSARAAEEGGKAVSATVNAMKEIAAKIGIIEEIARSTNMLALNASIEAARAGEYGKGFAVVAAEVGKLAERSQKEAGEISKLSSESVSIAEQAGETISSMIPDIKRTAELVQEISAASNEQNSGAEQINAAIMQLDQVVQQNASASEESASMSEELASQADQMQSTMGFFKISGTAAIRAKAPAERPVTRQVAPAAPAVPTAEKPVKEPSRDEEPKKAQAPAEKANDEGAKPAARKKDSPRKPITGVHIVLDDDVPLSGKDSIDGDFKEF